MLRIGESALKTLGTCSSNILSPRATSLHHKCGHIPQFTPFLTVARASGSKPARGPPVQPPNALAERLAKCFDSPNRSVDVMPNFTPDPGETRIVRSNKIKNLLMLASLSITLAACEKTYQDFVLRKQLYCAEHWCLFPNRGGDGSDTEQAAPSDPAAQAAMLRAAAAMGAPTRTGLFSESLSKALGAAYGQPIRSGPACAPVQICNTFGQCSEQWMCR